MAGATLIGDSQAQGGLRGRHDSARLFASHVIEPQYARRMSHDPPIEAYGENAFGPGPHADSSFLTMSVQNEIPGIEIGGLDGGRGAAVLNFPLRWCGDMH